MTNAISPTPRNLRTAYNRGAVIKCARYGTEIFSILGFHYTTAEKHTRHYLLDNDHHTLAITIQPLPYKLRLVLSGKAKRLR